MSKMTTEAKIKNTYTEQSKRTEDFKPPPKRKDCIFNKKWHRNQSTINPVRTENKSISLLCLYIYTRQRARSTESTWHLS
jgi:hypothetical protein